MIGDSGVNEMKDTTLTLYPSVLDDNSRSFFHLQDQKRANAVNSFGSDRCDKAHQEDGVGGEENDIDSLVAQDLNSLSMAERERILHDFHGVAETTTENPPQIARCLHTLDHELDRITNRSTSVAPAVDNGRPETSSDGDHATSLAAYNMAKQLSPEYVSNRSFRLMFLRADQFDGEQAAIRIANFFRAKLDLFGPTKLVKDITLDDLNEDDKAILNSGVLQASDEKDQAGRPLLCDFINYRRRSRGKSAHGSSKVSMLRVYFYLIMATMQDDAEAQRRGAVKISCCLDESGTDLMSHNDRQESGSTGRSNNDSKPGINRSNLDLDLMYSLATLQSCLPIRFASLHYFYSEPSVQEMYSTARLALGKSVRVRSRAFDGTPMEINYELLSYGIRMHIIPSGSATGDGSLASHKNWIEMQRRKEQNSPRMSPCYPLGVESACFESLVPCPQTPKSTKTTSDYPQSSAKREQTGAGAEVSCLGRVAENAVSAEVFEAAKTSTTSSQSKSSTNCPQESSKKSLNESEVAVVPQPNDVLFGRGRNVQDHPGNLRLHQLIEENRSRYENAPKWEKTVIASEIVAIIKEENGRFLKAISGSGNKKFAIQDSEAARDKVSHTFRSRRTAENNIQTAVSSTSTVSMHPTATSNCDFSSFMQSVLLPSQGFSQQQHQGPVNAATVGSMMTLHGGAGHQLWECATPSQYSDHFPNPMKRPKL